MWRVFQSLPPATAGGVGQFSRGDAGNMYPRMVRRDDDCELIHSDHRRGDVRRVDGGLDKAEICRTGADQVRHGGGITGEQPHAHIGCSVPVRQ